jgi:hypothetical protein
MCASSVPENSTRLIALIEACDWRSPKVRNQWVVVLRQARTRSVHGGSVSSVSLAHGCPERPE